MAVTQGTARPPIGLMRGVAVQVARARANGWIVSAEWAGFRGGGRAQVLSLPVDDPWTSDAKGVNSTYTPMTVADYVGAGMLTLGEIIGIESSGYPNNERWLNTIKAMPSWSAVNEGHNGFVAAMNGKTLVTLA